MKTPSIQEITGLLKAVKKTIRKDYRASDEPEDNKPGICVTIGANTTGEWDFQTGSNEFHGGSYGYPFWGVISLYKNSNCRELAKDCIEQIHSAKY